MKAARLTSSVVVLFMGLIVVGCDERVGTDAIPMRDLEHLRTFLVSKEWRPAKSAQAQQQWFRFRANGDFEAGGPGITGVLGLPVEVQEVVGTWRVTDDALYLSEITVDDHPQVEVTLPLTWVDGKVRIEISGVQYVSRWLGSDQ